MLYSPSFFKSILFHCPCLVHWLLVNAAPFTKEKGIKSPITLETKGKLLANSKIYPFSHSLSSSPSLRLFLYAHIMSVLDQCKKCFSFRTHFYINGHVESSSREKRTKGREKKFSLQSTFSLPFFNETKQLCVM